MAKFRKPITRRVYRLGIVFAILQKGPLPEMPVDVLIKVDDEESNFSRIRCPLCKWQPRATDSWMCGEDAHPPEYYAGCGATWNTFDSHGRCPGCSHQWTWTSCLSCEMWSLHEDWYAKEEK